MSEKKCHICEKELSTSLDEFGDAEFPVCNSCWLDVGIPHGNIFQIPETLTKKEWLDFMEKELEELVSETTRLKNQIFKEIAS
ncbi:hypothetical protein LCGC14_2866770, partial [marine sediment metagenome]